jgi:hypothetical protein
MLLFGNTARLGGDDGTELALLPADAARGSEQETAMAYHTNVGPLTGPLLASAGYFAIGVLSAPQAHTPIGTALVTGQDQEGLARWRVTIDEIELPGLWVVIDREFRPSESSA